MCYESRIPLGSKERLTLWKVLVPNVATFLDAFQRSDFATFKRTSIRSVPISIHILPLKQRSHTFSMALQFVWTLHVVAVVVVATARTPLS